MPLQPPPLLLSEIIDTSALMNANQVFGLVSLLFTTCNILIFYYFGRQAAFGNRCKVTPHASAPAVSCSRTAKFNRSSAAVRPQKEVSSKFSLILSHGLVQYKEERLINVQYQPWSLLMHQKSDTRRCMRMIHEYPSMRRKFSCLAVSLSPIESALNLLRHEEPATVKQVEKTSDSEEAPTNSTGFFGNVANNKGRMLLAKKMSKLLIGLEDLQSVLLEELASRSLRKGDSLVVMVLNAGEMDMFANLICSCRRNGLSVHNMLVFSSDADVVPLVRAFGVMAVHHRPSFATAPRRAAFEYLDPIFIDMMWYKAFSVWVCLHLGYDVLFQDVDIVWFKNPFDYFKAQEQWYIDHYGARTDMHVPRKWLSQNSLFSQSSLDSRGSGPDGFFSDDGQRSLRYAPFYFNSGFYFLRSNPQSLQFAWSILSSFAILHITGSHQNVFTLKLLEALDVASFRPAVLPLKHFPSGVKFSHDRPFMRAIRDGHEKPYIFHMCWTRNKDDKLINFRMSSMWYVRDDASQLLYALANTSLSTAHIQWIDEANLMDTEDVDWRKRMNVTTDRVCQI